MKEEELKKGNEKDDELGKGLTGAEPMSEDKSEGKGDGEGEGDDSGKPVIGGGSNGIPVKK